MCVQEQEQWEIELKEPAPASEHDEQIGTPVQNSGNVVSHGCMYKLSLNLKSRKSYFDIWCIQYQMVMCVEYPNNTAL